MKTLNKIDNVIEALCRHEDPKSIEVLQEIGTNSEIDEIREKTSQALIRKNTPESLYVVISSAGKGINDLSARVAMSSINEILSLSDKTEVIKVLEDTMNSDFQQEIKDTARSVKALITYTI